MQSSWISRLSLCFYFLAIAIFGLSQERSPNVNSDSSQRLKALEYELFQQYENAKIAFQKNQDIELNGHLKQANFTLQNIKSFGDSIYGEFLPGHLLFLLDIQRFSECEIRAQEMTFLTKKIYRDTSIKYALSLDMLGSIYGFLRKFEIAKEKLLESLYIKEKKFGQLSEPYLFTLYSIIQINAHSTTDYNDRYLIREYLLLAKKVYGKKHPRYLIVRSELGNIYLNDRQYHLAEPIFKEVVEGLKEYLDTENGSYYCSALLDLADLYLRQKKYPEAIQYYKEVLNASENVRFGSAYQMPVKANLVYAYWTFGDLNAAKTELEFLSDLLFNYFNSVFSQFGEIERLNVFPKLEGTLQLIKGFIVENIDSFPELSSLLLELEVNLQGLGLEYEKSIRKGFLTSTDENLSVVYKDLLIKKEKFASIQNLSNREKLERKINEKKLKFEIDSLQSILEANLFEKNNTRITTSDIKSKLSAREAAIIFIEVWIKKENWIYALVQKPDEEFPTIVQICQANSIKPFFEINALHPNSYSQKEKNAENLYRLIWSPILPYLKDIDSIHFRPSGLLHLLAFTALKDPDSKLKLTQKYQLYQYATFRDFLRIGQDDHIQINSGAVFGNLTFDDVTGNQHTLIDNGKNTQTVSAFQNLRGGQKRIVTIWNELPGTLEEMEFVYSLFSKKGIPVKKYQKSEGNEFSFKQLSGRAPKLLHIATHGFFFPDATKNYDYWENILSFSQGNFQTRVSFSDHPLFRSGLLLSGANNAWKGHTYPNKEDGILTAYEIAGLDLSTTELVILSACDTGIGELFPNAGVFGLQYAFKLAGVKKLLMSLWKIDDTSTVEFMKLFYSNYLNSNDVNQALRATQTEMINRNIPAYYWAGFILMN